MTRHNNDENYIIDLCDGILGFTALRQHRFDFLLGDPNAKGKVVKLPVDAYYVDLRLVIEYRERQHTEKIDFFDKKDKMTVSGVHRGEQRKIYDDRRRKVLAVNGVLLIEVSYSDFKYNKSKRIIRNENSDIEIMAEKLRVFIGKR